MKKTVWYSGKKGTMRMIRDWREQVTVFTYLRVNMSVDDSKRNKVIHGNDEWKKVDDGLRHLCRQNVIQGSKKWNV